MQSAREKSDRLVVNKLNIAVQCIYNMLLSLRTGKQEETTVSSMSVLDARRGAWGHLFYPCRLFRHGKHGIFPLSLNRQIGGWITVFISRTIFGSLSGAATYIPNTLMSKYLPYHLSPQEVLSAFVTVEQCYSTIPLKVIQLNHEV